MQGPVLTKLFPCCMKILSSNLLGNKNCFNHPGVEKRWNIMKYHEISQYLNKKHGISTLVAFLSTNSWMLHLTNLSGDNPGDTMVFSVGFMGGLKRYQAVSLYVSNKKASGKKPCPKVTNLTRSCPGNGHWMVISEHVI